jgi:hypothetical protein
MTGFGTQIFTDKRRPEMIFILRAGLFRVREASDVRPSGRPTVSSPGSLPLRHRRHGR